ncbi:MAG TPA: DUF924 family protein [Stellaceae bacterium]|nr:DUF924 family protein [Stellaceae bacterium]
MSDDASRVAALLAFWFGAPGSPEHDTWRAIWFKADAAFDAALGARFGEDRRRAAAGQCDHWGAECDAALALLLLLDQLPRNLYRGQAAAFATDAKARAAARAALARGFDQALPPVRRVFLYLPFEHSEDLADQDHALALFTAMPPGPRYEHELDYARRHHAIIARFGRFPHRNRALGRVSTAEEEDFLKQPGSSF